MYALSASGAVASTTAVAVTAAIVTASVLLLSRELLWPRWAKILRSPLETSLPHMSEDEIRKLVYRPDDIPGARDVETPYGSIRAYEFGPEDGQKVLLVHGISTSSIAFQSIAQNLAKRGCRVMLFDLFGRGYSDGVGDIPHDARLYVSQILLILASSPLSWSGDNSIHVIGYSLGGGVAIHFACTFPRMVKSVVLLAPAGLIRPERHGRVIKFFSGIVPDGILFHLISRRMQQKPIAASAKVPKPSNGGVGNKTEAAVKIAAAEIPNTLGEEDTSKLPIEKRLAEYARWMVAQHPGFVPAFISCLRHAPLMHQQESWKLLAQRKPGTVAVILAESDEIINLQDYQSEGLPLLGGYENVYWRVLPGSHDFIMTHPDAITKELNTFWDMKAPI